MTGPSAEQKLLWSQTITTCLIGVITDLAVAQVKLRNGNAETALAETLAMIETSMNATKATFHSNQGPSSDRSEAIRKALRTFLPVIEDNSRRSLGMVPLPRSRN